MADEVNINYGAFRRIKPRMIPPTELTADRIRHNHKSERNRCRILEMPMFKNLPTGGFNYQGIWCVKKCDVVWLPLEDLEGTFRLINDHVKHLSPEETDIFCSQVLQKATELLDTYGLSGAAPEYLWELVAQDLGMNIRAGTYEGRVFWAWGTKLVAARIAWHQDNTPEKLQVLTEPDNSVDFIMHDQPDKNVPDTQLVSYAAPSVDNFIAKGVLKFGGQPDKIKAILRYHALITPSKPGPVNASNTDSSAAKVAPGSRLQDSHRPVNATIETKRTVNPFGSNIGVGGLVLRGSMNRAESSKEISRSPVVPSEPQNDEATAQVSNDRVGAVDALVIGMHGTTIQDGGKGPGVFANLAIRTVNPLKRRHDDTEQSGATSSVGKPPAKMAKIAQVQANASGLPSQRDEP